MHLDTINWFYNCFLIKILSYFIQSSTTEIKEKELITTEKFSTKQLDRYIWFCKFLKKMLTENFFWVISAIPFILFPSVFIWLGFFELNVMTIFLFTIVHFLFWFIKGRKEAIKVIDETLPELEITIDVLENIRKEREITSLINKELNPTKGELTMGEVLRVLNELTNGDAIIVTDVGQHQMFACRYAKFNSTKSNVTSGGLGTMGFALPAAIGAKMGMPEREVVAIIGDGGYQMTIQELGVIFQHKLPVKIVVLNNDHLGMVRQWQEFFYENRYSESYMDSLPNFVKLAEAYGHVGMQITKPGDVEAALKEAFAMKSRFVFMDFITDQKENVFPMIQNGKGLSDMILAEDL